MTTPPTPRPRAGYESLQTYTAGNDLPCAIDLSDNTNQWGAAPPAVEALARAATAGYTRYPSRYAEPLKEAIGARYGVPAEMVVTGAGSDGVLEPAIRAFGAPGDALAFPDPTFVMARSFALMNGLLPAPVPLRADYDADPDALLATGAAIIYLCTPNNPTGRALSRAAIERVVERARGLVIIDEAYAEFAACDMLDLARRSDRVLVVRTLSKAYGLAGLRIGYGVASPALITAVEKARGPYTVSGPAELAAVAAVGEGYEWMRARAADALAARSRLEDALRTLGLAPVASDANFVFVPVADARTIADALAQRGVAVRAFSGLPAVSPALSATGGCGLRITVAPPQQMDAAVAALADVLAEEVRP